MHETSQHNLSPLPNFSQMPQSPTVLKESCLWPGSTESPHVHDTLSPQRSERLPHWLMLWSWCCTSAKIGALDAGIQAVLAWKLTKFRFGIQLKFGQKNLFLRIRCILDPFHPWQITSNLFKSRLDLSAVMMQHGDWNLPLLTWDVFQMQQCTDKAGVCRYTQMLV